jgi:hypothetical protein
LAASTLAVCNDSTVWTASFGNSGFFGKLCSDLVSVILIDTSSKQQVLLLLNLSSVVHILTWVGCLVFEDLDEFVKAGRDDGSEDGPQPIDPVVRSEFEVDYSRAE